MTRNEMVASLAAEAPLPPFPTPDMPPEEVLAALVAWCGGLPFAIDYLAAGIEQNITEVLYAQVSHSGEVAADQNDTSAPL